MADTKPQEPDQSAHERAYAVVCLVALLMVVLMLMMQGMGVWSVLPMLVGGVAFLLRWRGGPPLVVVLVMLMAPTHVRFDPEPVSFLSLAMGWLIQTGFYARRQAVGTLQLEDVLLAVGLVTYVAACYRSLALSHSVIPAEFTRMRGFINRGQPLAPRVKPPRYLVTRPSDRAKPVELPFLFGALAVSLLAGFVLWLGSSLLPTGLGLPPNLWRNVVAFWVCTLLVSLSLAVFRYVARLRAPRDENLLYLQDQVWRQTRHEQGVVNRWLVWARLQRQGRKES